MSTVPPPPALPSPPAPLLAPSSPTDVPLKVLLSCRGLGDVKAAAASRSHVSSCCAMASILDEMQWSRPRPAPHSAGSIGSLHLRRPQRNRNTRHQVGPCVRHNQNTRGPTTLMLPQLPSIHPPKPHSEESGVVFASTASTASTASWPPCTASLHICFWVIKPNPTQNTSPSSAVWFRVLARVLGFYPKSNKVKLTHIIIRCIWC